MHKNLLFPVFSCLLLVFTSISVAHSQDFEVAPVKLNYNCEAGQIQTKTMTIRNHSTQKEQFTLTVADMQLDSGKNNKSCKDWITINPSFFDVNPNESMEVKVIMQVPPGQSSTVGAIIHVTATEEQTSIGADRQMKSAVKVRPRIAVKVVQSPRSNTKYKGAISNLKEITQAKDTARSFEVKISNTGDKMLEGKIYLVLSNLETAKEIKAKPKKASLFPGTSKNIILSMPQNVPAGKYSLAAILDYGNNSSLEAVQINIQVK